jgi:hypothetical protein
MAIIVGTDTYISVANASVYVTNNYISTDSKRVAWFTLTDADKEIFLKKATKKIDRQRLRGIKAIFTQTLAFPRAIETEHYNAEYYKNISIINYSGYVVEPEVSQIVKDAEVEEALSIMQDNNMSNKRAELQAQGVKSFSLGSLSETYVVTGASNTETQLLSNEAKELLRYYLLGAVNIK